ncbi:MAG: CarD family transcriptional regulator, partial [Planctomycetia bacterium]
MVEPTDSRREGRLLGLADTLGAHEGFAEVVASLQQGHGGAVGGTWGSASALCAAALAAAVPDGPLVVVLPHAADAESCVDDLALFTSLPVTLLPAPEDFGPASEGGDPTAAERLAVVKRLIGPPHDRPRIIVTSIQALLCPLADPREIEASTRRLAVGERLDPAELADWLTARGWHAADAIDTPGSFARRGGILDLFAGDWDRPVRLELFGDEIESLRTFDTVSQRSVDTLESVDLTVLSQAEAPGSATPRRGQLADIVPPGSWWALVEPGELTEEAERSHQRLVHAGPDGGAVAGLSPPDEVFARIYRFPSVTFAAVAPSSLEASATLAAESVERFTGVLDRVREELETVGRDQEVWIVAPTEAEETRLAELFAERGPARSGRLHFARGRLSAGFRLVPEKIVVISSGELFRREDVTTSRPVRQRLSRAIDTFLDLHEGDFVVHVAHGVGRYRGLKLLEKHGRTEEFLEVEFAENTRIYVPASCIELVQKYVGGTKLAPRLAKVGGTLWERQKRAVEQAVADMAADMIQLLAKRESRPGVSFPPDTPWQRAFEESFPFDETPDQLTAAEAIRGDLERPRPMDRLLCGDVGFGKTEMAMRAAFKVVEAGAQVAVLVPTTVLAEQHRRTFTARFSEFPFTIRSLSRLTGGREERDTLEGLARGSVDIVDDHETEIGEVNVGLGEPVRADDEVDRAAGEALERVALLPAAGEPRQRA